MAFPTPPGVVTPISLPTVSVSLPLSLLFGFSPRQFGFERYTYAEVVRETRSGKPFAVWDGSSAISASVDFDLADTVAAAQGLVPENLDTFQDCPIVEPDDKKSNASLTPLSSPPTSQNSSPLSSPPPSPGLSQKKRKRKTRRSKRTGMGNPSTADPLPKPNNTQKASTARGHVSRREKRTRTREEQGPIGYKTRSSVGEKMINASLPVTADFDSYSISKETSGYLSNPNRVNNSKKEWTLQELSS
ncbi:hypothetical protein K435DRAFT_878835 [Dendrothele bispora CBS 962.96]|uniref:Uncharacterized protein n=1 Tax=Dendrothele bispora (strain CBS 962.96) TaxID=1314807 RepID=A0A4S8KM54_DENBC|nr:hypothetical protein K435DRAFT_878835 [Dendrothele bispora CBS 962.96]